DRLRSAQPRHAEVEVMPMDFNVAGQHVVVVGAGRSGLAAVDLLLSRGAVVSLVDSNPAVEGAGGLRARGVEVFVGPDADDVPARADLIVLSPGVPRDARSVSAARAQGVPVIGEVELA